jgi:hypothetical protein
MIMTTNYSDSSFIRDRGQPRPEKPPQLQLRPGEIPSKNPSQPKPNNDSQK